MTLAISGLKGKGFPMRTKLIVAMVIGIIVAVALFMRGEKNPTTAAVPGAAGGGAFCDCGGPRQTPYPA